MMKNRRWITVLAVLLMCVLLCSGTVFAQEAATEEEDTFHVPFFDQLEAGNKVSATLFIAGGALILVGAVGVVCLIVWHHADKRRNRMEEDREDIFDEIQQAEMRTRRMQEAERRAQQAQANRAPVYNQYPQAPASYPREQPLVPSTPVSMQPGAVQRARVPAEAAPVQPRPTMQSAPQTQPAANPQSAAKPKYDLDDILREIRESKTQ